MAEVDLMKCLQLLLFLVLIQSASAMPVIDQEFPAWDNVGYYLDYPGDYMAQTFTVRNSGQMISLGIRVRLSGYSHYKPPIDDLLVQLIRTDEFGAPAIDQVLASRRYNRFDFPRHSTSAVNYLDFDLTDWNIHVSIDEVLAIALSSNQTAYSGPANSYLYDHYNYVWHTSFGNLHPGGDFYLYSPNLFGPSPHKWEDRPSNPTSPPFPRPTRDMGFRVMIAVPEPDSVPIIACSLIGIAALRPCWARRHRRINPTRAFS
jgi:hypothetical protein